MTCPNCDRLTRERDEARAEAEARYEQREREVCDFNDNWLPKLHAAEAERDRLRGELERLRSGELPCGSPISDYVATLINERNDARAERNARARDVMHVEADLTAATARVGELVAESASERLTHMADMGDLTTRLAIAEERVEEADAHHEEHHRLNGILLTERDTAKRLVEEAETELSLVRDRLATAEGRVRDVEAERDFLVERVGELEGARTQLAQADAQVATLRAALERIERWEMPAVRACGRCHATMNGAVCSRRECGCRGGDSEAYDSSYGVHWGSNGERDVVRQLAADALATTDPGGVATIRERIRGGHSADCAVMREEGCGREDEHECGAPTCDCGHDALAARFGTPGTGEG